MVGIFLSCPLFRPRSCRCSRCLLFACQEELLYKHHTLDCVYMYLVWNLNQLFNGKYPRHGFNGAPLSVQGAARAGDWVCNSHRCFQVTEIRGDWAWHKMIFRFNSSWKAGSNMPVCFKCRAYGTGPTQSLYYNIEKIHHVGKQNTPMLQTSLRNSARPVHVTWQKPWLQFMFCLFSRLRGGVQLQYPAISHFFKYIQTMASLPAFAWPRSLGIPQVLPPRSDQVMQHAHPQLGILLFYKRWGFDAM